MYLLLHHQQYNRFVTLQILVSFSSPSSEQHGLSFLVSDLFQSVGWGGQRNYKSSWNLSLAMRRQMRNGTRCVATWANSRMSSSYWISCSFLESEYEMEVKKSVQIKLTRVRWRVNCLLILSVFTLELKRHIFYYERGGQLRRRFYHDFALKFKALHRFMYFEKILKKRPYLCDKTRSSSTFYNYNKVFIYQKFNYLNLLVNITPTS